jgi:hypothetical protein
VDQPAASIAIFRAGTHTSTDGRTISFSEDAVRELAETYDPAIAEAPLVVGHPKIDAPAYGWAKSLRAEGGVLYVEPHQVEPQFAELVNAGRYKQISSKIYLPNSKGNPKPGKHYLQHIGFLGAAAPAVKGLRSAQFAANDEGVEFSMPLGALRYTLIDMFQRIRDYFVERDGAEAADRIIPQWSIRSIDESLTERDAHSVTAYADPGNNSLEITMSDQNAIAQREQQIADREAALKAREATIAAAEQKKRRDDVAAFAAALVQDGKLLPREQAPIVEILLSLPADTSVSFAEGDGQVTKAVGDVLQQFLTGLPKRIDFAEKSPPANASSVEFAAPPGAQVDTSQMDLYARARAYQVEHPNVAWMDAVRAVRG